MFKLDFFKDKIDTDKIHEQTPPIDKEVVKLINDRINEERYNQDSKNYDKLVLLHDGTVYQGQWSNNKRHGKGILYKKSDDGNLKKVYQGTWINDKPDDDGTYYDGTDSVKVRTSYNSKDYILWYTRSPTTMQDTWTIKAAFRQKLYLNNRFATRNEYRKREKELDDFKYRKFKCNGREDMFEHVRNMVSRLCNLVYFGKGDIYIGQFDTEHLRHGQGLNFNADGTVYSGTWQNNKKHGPAILYSHYNVCHNDKHYIIEMIKHLIIRYTDDSGLNWRLIPISTSEYWQEKYKPFKEVLEAQEKRVSEMGLDKQARYKEDQLWENGELIQSTKVELPSEGESD